MTEQTKINLWRSLAVRGGAVMKGALCYRGVTIAGLMAPAVEFRVGGLKASFKGRGKHKTMYGATPLIPSRSEAMFWGLLIWLVAVLVIRPSPSQALTRDQSGSLPLTSRTVGSLDPQEVGALFDKIVPQQLDEYHIPGAAVAVVQDGEIVFAQGYGFADLEQKRPVVAEQTLFRTGSAAKLFTWTAVMQLVEQGKLDLSTDVNNYLSSFRIPDTYPESITLEHLMTHTAGFEDLSMGAMRARPEGMEPLGTFLARKVPARVYPPGQVTAYSNYGTALAGYIVEQVSGLPFDQYVEQNIFTPLGMGHTTFRQPVPVSLVDELATGYVHLAGAFQPQPFEVYQIGPAGGASATVSDMARFMIAHLKDGKYGDARILGEQTAQLMHQRHFSNDPKLTGMAYGFYELRVNGRLLLTHAGETSFFRSQLCLLHQEDLGLYVVYNAPGGGPARQELIQVFFDRFYSMTPISVPQPPTGATQRGSRLAGRYISTRSAQTTIEKLRLLIEPLYQPITVWVTEDGYLESEHPSVRSQGPALYQPRRWVETESNLYMETNGRDSMAFRQDDQGNLMLFLDSAAPRGYRKLAWYEELLFQPLLPLGLGMVLFGVLAFALFDKQALPAARWLAVGSGGVVLAFLLGLAAFAFLGFTDYLYGQASSMWWVVFALPMVLIFLTMGLAAFTLLPWPGAGVLRHVPYALAVLAAAGLLWWFNYWSLLGWRL
jgi:CubicO group peptidase (beta-lactamase class C family)